MPKGNNLGPDVHKRWPFKMFKWQVFLFEFGPSTNENDHRECAEDTNCANCKCRQELLDFESPWGPGNVHIPTCCWDLKVHMGIWKGAQFPI
jgi:hypothetical protein